MAEEADVVIASMNPSVVCSLPRLVMLNLGCPGYIGKALSTVTKFRSSKHDTHSVHNSGNIGQTALLDAETIRRSPTEKTHYE